MVEVACVAVIVELPTPIIVTVVPEIVATAVLELVYVNAPVLLDDGAVSVKGSPTVFAGTEKLVIVGVALFTTNDAVIVPAK